MRRWTTSAGPRTRSSSVHLRPRRHARLARPAAQAKALGGVDPGARHRPLPRPGQAGPHVGRAADACGPGPDAAARSAACRSRPRCRGPTSRACVLGKTDRGPDSAFFQIFVPFAGDGTPRPWRGVRTERIHVRPDRGGALAPLRPEGRPLRADEPGRRPRPRRPPAADGSEARRLDEADGRLLGASTRWPRSRTRAGSTDSGRSTRSTNTSTGPKLTRPGPQGVGPAGAGSPPTTHYRS